MQRPDLLIICGAAFLLVFVILAVLALVMRLIIILFPENVRRMDAGTLAAVAASVQTALPGAKILNIEERK